VHDTLISYRTKNKYFYSKVDSNENVGQKDGNGWVLVWDFAIDGYLPFEHAVFV
jgi:hypothetical protein